ncbi:MAG: hypothetical protein Q4G41_05020, partial [Coriobacteriales bacterium]|nr:hypothetical protein [Coriobacteriales bacterium]
FTFIAILGGIVQILVVAGGAEAFASWSEARIKTRRGAQLATFGMGISILIDDYFNALTVGNVMQPISDRLHISRAKLAYNIDSTSAPDTILFPMSSWVATCIMLINPVMQQYGCSSAPCSSATAFPTRASRHFSRPSRTTTTRG